MQPVSTFRSIYLETPVSFPLIPSVLQPPHDSDRAAWYRSPQLFVMTAFIANTTDGIWGRDFITRGPWTPESQQETLATWRNGLGCDYDAERVTRTFQEAGATGVIFYDKWHDGLVCHDTALTAFKTDRDFLGETIAALQRRQMKVVVYYSVGLDYNPEFRDKNWVCRDATEKPIGLAFPEDWQSLHSPYRRYVIDQLVEILHLYGPIDGFWLDILGQPNPFYQRAYGFGPAFSSDCHTRTVFESWNGKPIEQASEAELATFHIRTLAQFWTDLRTALDAELPGVALTWNGAGRDDLTHPVAAFGINDPADWFSVEGHAWPTINRSAHLSQAVARPVEVGMLFSSSWYAPLTDKAPPPAMTDDDALIAAGTAWVHGLNIYAALTPGHSGLYDETSDLSLLRRTGEWLQAHRNWLQHTEPYAEIGIVAGHPAPTVFDAPTRRTLWPSSHRTLSTIPPPTGELSDQPGIEVDEQLGQSGYQTERVGGFFTNRQWDLSAYRLVFLPENALLDDETIEALRAYVRKGGTLLATGHASLLDVRGVFRVDYALANVFGVSYRGALPGYKQWERVTVDAPQAGLGRNAGALKVVPTTGTALSVWRGADDAPALVSNTYGMGSCLYLSAEENALESANELLTELVDRLIGPPAIRVNPPLSHPLVVRQRGEELLITLFHSATSPGIPHSNSIELMIDARTSAAIVRAEQLPSGTALPLIRAENTLRCMVPAFTGARMVRLIRSPKT